MYLIVLCFMLHQIVGLKTQGYDLMSLAMLFVGLKTQCYPQHQMSIWNIRKHLGAFAKRLTAKGSYYIG